MARQPLATVLEDDRKRILQDTQALCSSVQVLLFHYEIITHKSHPINKVHWLLEEFGVFLLTANLNIQYSGVSCQKTLHSHAMLSENQFLKKQHTWMM